MKKNYFSKVFLTVGGAFLSLAAMAIEAPQIGSTLTDGVTYVLISAANSDNYWTRTSWDGAFYLQPFNLENQQKAAFKAQHNDDGTWCFLVESDTAKPYLGIPSGSANLNTLEAEAKWSVEQSDREGYYKLVAGEGNCSPTIGHYLHLNNGCQYVVITYEGNSWYPDYYGGVKRTEDEFEDIILGEDGYIIPNDRISEYWMFADIENLASFTQKMQLYTAIKKMEDNMLEDETYKAGFQSAIDAATVFYEKTDITDEDMAAALDIINAKNNFYNEIQTAIALEPDATLQAAIDAAIAAFNASNENAEALADLKAAETAFTAGTGDFTLRGQNMSFEDLSAQNGGTQDGGVGNPPVGWNVYINDKACATAADVQANGIGGWFGVNADCEGPGMDGNVAFGIWNSGIPKFEISQTITGLENGTYIVTAGVMAGGNGNGSRMTTQRLFGNLNSTYVLSETDYNHDVLDKSEVFAFEGLEEESTDRNLRDVSVRAYVYDGTLTFGLRTDNKIAATFRDTGNSAGGDGWFKVDNFRIVYEGYNADDALNIYNHYRDAVLELEGEPMQKSLQETLEDLADNEMTEDNTQEEVIAAIFAAKNLYPEITKSIEAYTNLGAAIDNAYDALNKYQNADDLAELVSQAAEMQDYMEATTDEVEAIIVQLNATLKELEISGITMGDITKMLANPSFEDLSAQGNTPSDGAANAPAGWDLYQNGEKVNSIGSNWCAINRGDGISVYLEDGTEITRQPTDGDFLWGIWMSDVPEVELSQTLTGMKPGTYTVEADVMVQFNWAGDCTTTQRIFGNNYVQMWGREEAYTDANLPEDARNAAELTYAGYVCASGLEYEANADLLHPMKVTFGVDDSGILKVGFRTNGVNADGLTFAEGGLNGQGWFKVDNFRLSWDSEEVPVAIKGVNNVKSGKTEFYSIDGRRLNAPQRGLNIMKSADGKTSKVIMK